MNRIVRVLSLIAWIAVILKLTMIPGGSVLLVLSLSLLALFYIVFGFAIFNKLDFKQVFNPDSYDTVPKSRISSSMGLGIAYSIVCVGILFKVQLWPGGDVHLRTGLVVLTGFLLYNLYQYYKTKSDFHRGISIRILMFGVLGVLVFNIPMISIAKFQFRKHPKYIEAFEKYESNPDDSTLIYNLDIEYQRATLSNEDFEGYLKKLADDKERATGFDFNQYLISQGRIGNIKLGMSIKSMDQDRRKLSKQEVQASDFGYDGGGLAYLYTSNREHVLALIPAFKTDSIIAIIALHKNFQTTNGIRVGMTVKEVLTHYPNEKINFNYLSGWEEIHDETNGFNLVFQTTDDNRIGEYEGNSEYATPFNLSPRLTWITIKK